MHLASLLLLAAVALRPAALFAQDADDGASSSPLRGSLVEDRAARKLVEAGDSRYDSDEFAKAVEIWQSVIERYPRSRVRFNAHMRLGNYFLDRDRAYDRARGHFAAAAEEENRDQQQRAEATLKMGVCFYEASNYGKSFKVMRTVIEEFPVSEQVNQAYYYIGLGHFQLGHYSRAIGALQKVGTAFSADDATVEKVEAGKRLFIKIEDADLAALEAEESITVQCKTTQGDVEKVVCYPVGRNVRVVLGSIITELGKPHSGDGLLQVQGDDKIEVTYLDAHTADRTFDRPLIKSITVVGNALVTITDGAYNEALHGTVLGKMVNVQVIDADRDLTDESDKLQAIVGVFREKTSEEIESETAAAIAKAVEQGADPETVEPKIDRYKEIDRVELSLAEALVPRDPLALPGAVAGDSEAIDGPADSSEPKGASAKPEAAPSNRPASKTRRRRKTNSRSSLNLPKAPPKPNRPSRKPSQKPKLATRKSRPRRGK